MYNNDIFFFDYDIIIIKNNWVLFGYAKAGLNVKVLWQFASRWFFK